MARSPKRRKRAPDPPDLPTELDPAPARLESRARWECVHAGGDVEVGAELAGVDIRESDWADADLAGRHLSGLHCRDVRFDRCDLSGAVLDAATLTRVLFTDCRLTGVVLNGATLQDVHVRGGRADMAYLRMAKANFLLVEDSPLREVDCYQATLAHTAFLGCDLRGANFQDCRLTDVDLHGSNLDGLRGALSLRGASIGIDQILPLAPSLLADAGISVTPKPASGSHDWPRTSTTSSERSLATSRTSTAAGTAGSISSPR